MQCPNCGRPISFEEKFAKVVACPYCNSILEFGSGELTKIGEQGDFIAFPSIFEVGKTTEYKWKKISTKWQIRYETDAGFFDDYFVEIDGKTFYIREEDGTIAFFDEPNTEQTNASLVDKIAWENWNFGGVNFFIEEVGIMKLANIRGIISSTLEPNTEYEYLFGVYNGKKYIFTKKPSENIMRINRELVQYEK